MLDYNFVQNNGEVMLIKFPIFYYYRNNLSNLYHTNNRLQDTCPYGSIRQDRKHHYPIHKSCRPN